MNNMMCLHILSDLVWFKSSTIYAGTASDRMHLLNGTATRGRLCDMGAFMDSTGVGRAWVAGSGDASALSTLKPIKRQTTKQLRISSL